MYTRETEIRHITSTEVFKLSLELEQSWKKLMRIIPKDLSSIKINTTSQTNEIKTPLRIIHNLVNEPIITKYTNDHILMVEKASLNQNRSSTEILLEEWGTSGRIRPNVGNLLDLLVQAEIYRAADFVAITFLNEPAPLRPLTGPAAKIDISIPFQSEEVIKIENILNDITMPGTISLNENAAQLSSETNNKDFYKKFRQNEKHLNIEYSDLMKFSSSTISSASIDTSYALSSINIPDLSALIETKNESINHLQRHISNESNENYKNGQFSYESMEDDDDDNKNADIDQEDDNIPIITALINGEYQNLSRDQQIPDLSILNVNSNDDLNNCNVNGSGENSENAYSNNNSRSGSFGNSSNLSTSTDEGSNVTSSSSTIDPKSNDSSLTNVTDTSENTSFESNDETSNPPITIEISYASSEIDYDI